MDKKPAKRIQPPNSIQEPRYDVPGGEALFEEWTAGQLSDPTVTYEDLARKYSCSTSLIHKRISGFSDETKPKRPKPKTEKLKPVKKSDALDRELRITQRIIEAFRQLHENCGPDAVHRAMKNVEMHMGNINE